MEYAAVFLLFALMVAAAVRVLVSGKGITDVVLLLLLFAALCLEPFGGNLSASPACVFLASVGAAYIGFYKNFAALFCSFAVAAIAVSSVDNSGAGFNAEVWGYVCSVLLCGVICRPRAAGAVLALGYALGDLYSVFRNYGVVYYADLFSVKVVYVALFCLVFASFINVLLKFSERDGEDVSGYDSRKLPALRLR